jgi:predicted outer membrane repeat protein
VTTTSVSGPTFQGSATFANGVFARRYTAEAEGTFEFPNACHGCRCADVEAMLRSTGYDASCNPVCTNGWCSCTVRASIRVNRSSTYTVSGTRITTSDGKSYEYCSDASGLALDEKTSMFPGVYHLGAWSAGPVPEVCDGVDNDASGAVDDGPVDCPPGCNTAGVCATGTTAVCNGATGWSCSYTALAHQAVETTCDRLDNDCDGTVDEGAQCGPEVCDGIDNDGSGVVDDALTDTPTCSTLGVCAAGSAPECFGSSGWSCVSTDPAHERIEASCDLLDNDCDGQVDEELAGALAANQAGVCSGSRLACSGGTWEEPDLTLVPAYEAVETLCDGKDNDCDGEVDEDLTAPLADKQLGVCEGARKVCSGAGGWIEPSYTSAVPGYVALEQSSCDGKDNDCDGTVDEGYDQDGDGYYTAANTACVATYGPLGKVDCDDAAPLLTSRCILYVNVDASGAGNGASWTDAFPSLQDALAAAKDAYQLWVAKGTYRPDRGAGLTVGDKAAQFLVTKRVSVYGGFAGTETLLEERNLAANETVLSGDLSGNDGPSFTNRTDNSYRVVTVSAAALLDGLTVRGGYGPFGNGAGAFVSAAATFAECVITDNYGQRGGGVYVSGGTPTLRDSFVTGNHANTNAGGIGVYAGTTTIAGTRLEGNSSTTGGGLYVESAVVLTDDAFSANSASTGGGIATGGVGVVSADGCTFTGNTASASGAGAALSGSSVVRDSVFTGNSATAGGGAVYAYLSGAPEVHRCVFTDNTAGRWGGAVQTSNSSPTFAGCVFNSNSASNIYRTAAYGGAFYVEGGATVVVNSTFSGNGADTDGGAIAVGTGTLALTNSVQWDDSRTALRVAGLTVSYSCTGDSSAGTANLTLTRSPFVDVDGADNVRGNADDDLRLVIGSDCVDSGDNAAVPAGLTTDLDGRPRIINNVVDRGAYEQ